MRTSTTYPVILLEDSFTLPQGLFLDVRSPSEFDADHIWQAQNLPLFNDLQRQIVGTIYRQKNAREARKKGGEITRERMGEILSLYFQKTSRPKPLDYGPWLETTLARFVGQHNLPRPQLVKASQVDTSTPPIFIYCWRGGMRSSSLTVFLCGMGENVYQLQGGYKVFRRFVSHQLGQIPHLPLVVIDGLTGVGKTIILHEIEKLYPHHTLDLEGLAGHRSSILGSYALSPRCQKGFESQLLYRVNQLAGRPLFVEGEARKIGNVEIPHRLYHNLESAPRVLITASLKVRIQRLMEEYVGKNTLEFLGEKLNFFERQMAPKHFRSLYQAFQQEDFEEITRHLILHYYDPLYEHALKKKKFALTLSSEDLEEVVERLLDFFGKGKKLD